MRTKRYCRHFDGQPITNQPDWQGIDTGWYEIEPYVGCWHRIQVTSGCVYIAGERSMGKTVYMIGEYPHHAAMEAKGLA